MDEMVLVDCLPFVLFIVTNYERKFFQEAQAIVFCLVPSIQIS